MHFRNINTAKILDVQDNFAHLADVSPTGDLTFEFTYSVSQRETVGRGALKVSIKLLSRQLVKNTILGETHRGHVDTRAVVKNARTMMLSAKARLLAQQTTYEVAHKNSDITKKINNEIVPQLRAQTPLKLIPQLTKPRLQLVPASVGKQRNDPTPILHRVAYSHGVPNLELALTASAGERPQALMHRMITQFGQDPTHIFDLAPRAVSAQSTHGGLSNPVKAHERVTDAAVRLLNHHLFPPVAEVPPRTTVTVADTELVHVLEPVTDDTATITESITIPVSKLRVDGAPLTQLLAHFELIDGRTNLPVDRVTKTLDIAKHVSIYHTPKIPPTVKAAASEVSSRTNLEIKQIDPGATEVEVYKKAFWVSTPGQDDYALIGTYQLTSRDQSLLIQVDKPRHAPVIYRVIPRGKQSVQSYEFTNITVKPDRYTPVRAVSLTAQQIDIGIQLEVRQIPTNVVAVQFLRWNLTTFESDYTTVGDDVGFIDDSVREADLLTTIDSTVKWDNIYAYQARLIYEDGHTSDFGNVTIEFIKPSPGEVDTRIENLLVDHDNTPNVSFTIETNIIDSDVDAIKKMLENQDMTSYFTGDIANQREQLKKLIAHQVHRIDLNTGHVDNFGILTDPQFDDSALRKNQAIGPLVHGHKYRYVVYPLLRSPETLFDSFKKEAVDPVTKKPYSYYPAKFRHPFTLKRGVIVSSNGILLRQAKDPMAHGVIGSMVSVDVSFDSDVAQITDVSAVNFDRYLNVITWKIQGEVHQIDHFIIMKQVHGIRSLLGKAHSEFTNNSCQYVHHISKHDVGALQYVIVPVFNDYRLGAEVVTNTLVVEEP